MVHMEKMHSITDCDSQLNDRRLARLLLAGSQVQQTNNAKMPDLHGSMEQLLQAFAPG